MINKNKLLLISVKPQYARKIFEGLKSIELRKSVPQRVGVDSFMLIYVTSPVKELWGICKIENILKDNPKEFWEKHGNQTGVSKQEFNDYFKNNNNAFGIKLKDLKRTINSDFSLKKMREIIPGFTPPQTYRYLDMDLIKDDCLKELFI